MWAAYLLSFQRTNQPQEWLQLSINPEQVRDWLIERWVGRKESPYTFLTAKTSSQPSGTQHTKKQIWIREERTLSSDQATWEQTLECRKIQRWEWKTSLIRSWHIERTNPNCQCWACSQGKTHEWIYIEKLGICQWSFKPSHRAQVHLKWTKE